MVYLILVLIFFLISCSGQKQQQSTSNNPEESFKLFIQKYKNADNYKIVYDINVANDFFDREIKNLNKLKLGIMKKGENKKSLIETTYTENDENFESKDSAISNEGINVYCEQFDQSSGTDCSSIYKNERIQLLDLSEKLDFIVDSFQKNLYDISIRSNKKIIGNKCTEFIIKSKLGDFLNESSIVFKDLFYEYSPETNSMVEICFDDDTGLPLNFNLYITTSELEDNNTRLFSYTASSLGKVPDSESLKPPLNYELMEFKCTMKEGVFIILPYIDFEGEVSITRSPGSWTGKRPTLYSLKLPLTSFKAGKPDKITFTIDNKIYDEFCIGDECEGISCLFNSTRCLKFSFEKDLCQSRKDCIYNEPLCQNKNCNTLKDKSLCINEGCVWDSLDTTSPYCRKQSCFDFKTQEDCLSNKNLKCRWSSNKGCEEIRCEQFSSSEKECLSSNLDCFWDPDAYPSYRRCEERGCGNIKDKKECEISKLNCLWIPFTDDESKGNCFRIYPENAIGGNLGVFG